MLTTNGEESEIQQILWLWGRAGAKDRELQEFTHKLEEKGSDIFPCFSLASLHHLLLKSQLIHNTKGLEIDPCQCRESGECQAAGRLNERFLGELRRSLWLSPFLGHFSAPFLLQTAQPRAECRKGDTQGFESTGNQFIPACTGLAPPEGAEQVLSCPEH